MAQPETEDRVLVGRVIGLWGVQGWLRIFSDTQPPDAIFSYRPWHVQGLSRCLEVLDWRRQGKRLVVRLPGFDDADQAADLIGRDILVDRACLPPVDPGRFYWSDLVGLKVANREGHELGVVHGLIETGANDVIDVRDEQGASVLVPFVIDQFILSVDLEARSIVVDWPLDWIES